MWISCRTFQPSVINVISEEAERGPVTRATMSLGGGGGRRAESAVTTEDAERGLSTGAHLCICVCVCACMHVCVMCLHLNIHPGIGAPIKLI